MIKSFNDSETEKVFQRRFSKKLPQDIQGRAQKKLVQLHAARRLDDLMLPPSNRLEALAGDREGWYSIRINKQWRICFKWKDGDASDVEIEDYH